MLKIQRKRNYQKFEIICKICNKKFYVSYCNKDRTKYCSKKCQNDRRTKITCQNCLKVFSVVNSRKDVAKYCSKKCKNDEKAHWLKCQYCKTQFRRTDWEHRSYKSSYCSTKCYSLGTQILVSCEGCKKDVKIYDCQRKYYDKHYCSNACRIKFGPIGKLTDKDVVDSNYYRFVRKVRHCKRYYEWRDKVRRKDDYKCVECNVTKKLTVHHSKISMYEFVKKHGFSLESIYLDVDFFNVKNGQLLCRSCHAKRHRE